MDEPKIAVLSKDPHIRLAIARALDNAPLHWSITMNDAEAGNANVVVRGPDVPGPGLLFEPDHPARLIADIERALASHRAGPRIVVAGATGGCGVTTIALHLCAAFTMSRSVCLLEAVPGCGVKQRLCLPDETLDRATEGTLSDLPVADGFHVSLAPRDESQETLQASVERLVARYELVVVDGGVGETSFPLSPDDVRVVVIPATVPGMLRARPLLDASPDARCATVVNRLGPGSDVTMIELQRILGHRISLELPCTPALRDAEDEGRLIARGWTRWYRSIERLARVLLA